MLFALHSRYHACWCTSDFRSQCIKGHGLVPQSRNIPYPASEELRMFNDRLISVIWISIPAKMVLILKQDPASKNISKPPSATIFPMLVDMGRQLSGSPRTNSTHTGPINIANGVELIVYLEDWLKCTQVVSYGYMELVFYVTRITYDHNPKRNEVTSSPSSQRNELEIRNHSLFVEREDKAWMAINNSPNEIWKQTDI